LHRGGYPVFSWETGRREEEMRQIFADCKVRHGKSYSYVAYEEHRYTVFKESLRDIDQHNAGYVAGVHSFIRGIGSLSDKTMEKLKAMGNGF
jgi:hypothetical protein